MPDEVLVDEDFVKGQIAEICRLRGTGLTDIPPPCQGTDRLCDIGEQGKEFELGKGAECIGSCFLGGDTDDGWFALETKRPLNICLAAAANIDWLLHLSRKRYRDHAAHQLFVGAFGWLLLESSIEPSDPSTHGSNHGGSLKGWVAEKLKLKPAEVEVAWWITSLLHDHAYPLAHMLRIGPCVAEKNRDVLLDEAWELLGFAPGGRTDSPLHTVFQGLYDYRFLRRLRAAVGEVQAEGRRNRILETLNLHLVGGFFETDEIDESDHVCYDHGLLGAANVAALLDISNPSRSIRAAVRAIGMHNGGACTDRVDAGSDPLAFLLILCDECQEWGRSIIVDDEICTECPSIRLRGLKRKDSGEYQIGHSLSVVFEYPNALCLEKTGWDYSLFRRSKEDAFRRLRISSDFPIKRIEFHVSHGGKFSITAS